MNNLGAQHVLDLKRVEYIRHVLLEPTCDNKDQFTGGHCYFNFPQSYTLGGLTDEFVPGQIEVRDCTEVAKLLRDCACVQAKKRTDKGGV